jgi:predicted ArsR family transcriptional regulator
MADDSPDRPKTRQVTRLTDPRALRAMAHPIRLSLIAVLRREGPLTATQAGDLINESSASCSFHLRQLAKYGFVAESGGGRGRQRPWRLSGFGLRFSEVQDNPQATLAAEALERALRGRTFARLQTWYETRRSYPTAWQEAAESGESLLWVTPEELRALLADLVTLLERYRPRLADPSLRPAGALPVEVLTFAYPIRPAGEGA